MAHTLGLTLTVEKTKKGGGSEIHWRTEEYWRWQETVEVIFPSRQSGKALRCKKVKSKLGPAQPIGTAIGRTKNRGRDRHHWWERLRRVEEESLKSRVRDTEEKRKRRQRVEEGMQKIGGKDTKDWRRICGRLEEERQKTGGRSLRKLLH